MIRRPPRSTLFPNTTPSRSRIERQRGRAVRDREARRGAELAEQPANLRSEAVGERHDGAMHVRILPLRGATDPGAGLPREYRSEEHTSELQSPCNLVCRLLL